MILKDVPTALRVGTVAHWEDRIARVMEIDRLDREQAEKTIIARDMARVYYYKRYFEIDDPDDPELYHLVLNTSDLDIDYATNLVVDAVRALEEGRLSRSESAAP